MTDRAVGIRWTIGAVTAEGFEALRLAVWGARKVFGPDAAYAICVNSLPVAEARRRTGPLPESVEWIAARGGLPEWPRPHVGENMAEGKAWKVRSAARAPGPLGDRLRQRLHPVADAGVDPRLAGCGG